jgi:hypothetical protein
MEIYLYSQSCLMYKQLRLAIIKDYFKKVQAPVTTQWNCNRMSTKRSCVCVSGLPRQTVCRHRSGNSFGNISK